MATVTPTPGTLGALSVVVVSLYTLVTASDRVVAHSLSVASHYDVPDVLVGMTVIAVGTSLPELGAHLVASLGIVGGELDYEVASAVVIGGNVGSSTVQQLLLVGLLVLGVGRVEFGDAFVWRSYVPMVAALVGALVLGWDGVLSRLDGAILLGAYVAYTAYSYRTRRRFLAASAVAASPPERPSGSVGRDVALAAGSLALVLASASLLLWIVESVIGALQPGGSTVGVLTIGIAAALPELSTVLDAVRRQAPEVALGVLVGSNVVNTLLGLGLGGAISTYHVPASVLVWDLPYKIVVAVGLLVHVRLGGSRPLTRHTGALLVVLYLAYLSGRLLALSAG